MAGTNENSEATRKATSDSVSVAEAVLLAQVADRLTSLEAKIAATSEIKSARTSWLLELVKLVFGGWPVLGLIFLLLFYGPLREALQAIPDKVRSADEIGLPGVSLKSTLRSEASRSGMGALAETLPYLSPGAVELLLRTEGNKRYGLAPLSTNEKNEVVKIWLPSGQQLEVIDELERAGLAEIKSESRNGSWQAGVVAARSAIQDFKKKYPGRSFQDTGSRDREAWDLEQPVARNHYHDLRIFWGTTDLGKQAVEVIIRAVATSLAEKSTPKAKTQ